MEATKDGHDWPPLVYDEWRDTLATLHLWTQVVGKVRLALTPWLNHGWHVPLYVHSRGLRTSTIHLGHRMFELDFDFVDHRFALLVSDRDGARRSIRAGSRACPTPSRARPIRMR